jgi:hypothetical protein
MSMGQSQNRRLYWAPVGTFAAALLALSSAAHADNIPAATLNGTLNGAGSALQTAGTITSSACNGDMGCEQATLSLAYAGIDASASAAGSTTGSNPANAAGGGSITYFFEVAGPTNSAVPLVFSASGSTFAAGTDTTAVAQAFSAGGAFNACSGTGNGAATCGNGAGGVLPSSFAGSEAFNLASNTLSDVEVAIEGSSTLGPGNWSTGVDPQISFAPGFASAGYTLEASPDLTPVPVPGTVWLMLAALGALALVSVRSGHPERP